MQAIPRAARQAVAPALVKAAEDVSGLMELLAPEDEGDLKNSISVTAPGAATPAYSQPGGSMIAPPNTALITVGSSDVRYPHLQEYGTAHHAAQPFFWPGFRLGRKKAETAIKRAIRKAIREAK